MDKEPFLSVAELHQWLADEDWYPSAHTKEWLTRTPPHEAADVLAQFAQSADLEPMNPLSVLVMVGVMGGFVPSQGAVGGKVLDRKAGIRAALYLAERGDVRAIAPLCRLWTASGIKKSKYHEQIVKELTRLLGELNGQDAPDAAKRAVHDLAGRIWATGGQKHDLTGPQADLIIAALHFLHSANEGSVFALGTPSRWPNRVRVQEGARSMAKP